MNEKEIRLNELGKLLAYFHNDSEDYYSKKEINKILTDRIVLMATGYKAEDPKKEPLPQPTTDDEPF